MTNRAVQVGEPEDRWAELADEMGVDLSDHDIAGADPAGSHS